MARQKEIWKQVHYKFYEVSSKKRVRRAKPGSGTHVGKLLKPYYPSGSKEGYIRLYAKDKVIQTTVKSLYKRVFK